MLGAGAAACARQGQLWSCTRRTGWEGRARGERSAPSTIPHPNHNPYHNPYHNPTPNLDPTWISTMSCVLMRRAASLSLSPRVLHNESTCVF